MIDSSLVSVSFGVNLAPNKMRIAAPILFLSLVYFWDNQYVAEAATEQEAPRLELRSSSGNTISIDGNWFVRDRVLVRFKKTETTRAFSGNGDIPLTELPNHLGLPKGVTIENGGFSRV